MSLKIGPGSTGSAQLGELLHQVGQRERGWGLVVRSQISDHRSQITDNCRLQITDLGLTLLIAFLALLRASCFLPLSRPLLNTLANELSQIFKLT